MTSDESELCARVAALFSRHPALCGFAVQHADAEEICIAELALHPATAPEPVLEEIAGAMMGLVDERPQLAARLAGRTFARALH